MGLGDKKQSSTKKPRMPLFKAPADPTSAIDKEFDNLRDNLTLEGKVSDALLFAIQYL